VKDAPRPDDRRWLDEPRHVTRVVYGLAALCALALVADFFYTKHPHFAVERLPAFYALYGFVGSVGLVLAAKGLRRWLMRDEDFYERRAGAGRAPHGSPDGTAAPPGASHGPPDGTAAPDGTGLPDDAPRGPSERGRDDR
jgi:hypothetical protein